MEEENYLTYCINIASIYGLIFAFVFSILNYFLKIPIYDEIVKFGLGIAFITLFFNMFFKQIST
jgi:hypothetical protein